MPFLEIDGNTRIHYVARPARGERPTFVFINSMGASTQTWESGITGRLTEDGFGTLSFDYRGQGKTTFGAEATLTPDEIAADIRRVLEAIKPQKPILVGLSIGGLFAMRAHLDGAEAAGIALVNTLRKPGTRVDWIAELEIRLIRLGGMQLVHDAIRPVLVSAEKLARIRPDHLPEDGYVPESEDAPRLRLAKGVPSADWDVPYEDLKVPVLVLSGGQDRLFRVPSDVDEICRRIPVFRQVVFENAGHALHADETEGFCKALEEFGSCATGHPT